MKHILLSILFLLSSLSWAKPVITQDKIIDTDPFLMTCNKQCGNTESYKLISIDLFDSVYSQKEHSLSNTKIGIKNLKISKFKPNCIVLYDSDYNYIDAVSFDSEVIETVIANKKKSVNIYGHVRNDTNYDYCILVDVIEFN